MNTPGDRPQAAEKSSKKAQGFQATERIEVPEATLPLATTAHAALDPIAAILSFYVMAAGLAAARGRNPDAPRHLNKVTETH